MNYALSIINEIKDNVTSILENQLNYKNSEMYVFKLKENNPNIIVNYNIKSKKKFNLTDKNIDINTVFSNKVINFCNSLYEIKFNIKLITSLRTNLQYLVIGIYPYILKIDLTNNLNEDLLIINRTLLLEFDNLPYAIEVMNEEGNYVVANKHLCDLLDIKQCNRIRNKNISYISWHFNYDNILKENLRILKNSKPYEVFKNYVLINEQKAIICKFALKINISKNLIATIYDIPYCGLDTQYDTQLNEANKYKLNKLYSTVIEGNGRPSLISKQLLLEKNINFNEERIHNLEKDLDIIKNNLGVVDFEKLKQELFTKPFKFMSSIILLAIIVTFINNKLTFFSQFVPKEYHPVLELIGVEIKKK